MKLKNIFLTLFLATTALNASAQMEQMMQPLPVDPQVRIGRLDNGLTYYIRHNEEPKDQAFFYIAQKVGSIQEEESQRGLAHFLEHMCFNGTTHFPDSSLVNYLESIGVKFGAQLNAYTSVEETVYNIDHVPAREGAIDSCLLILHDWSHDLTLDGKEIDKERGVIHGEWRMRNVGFTRILVRNLEKLMSNSRYGRRFPIGLMEVVDECPYDTLRAYYHKWYRPDLQGIIVVGDIDVDQIEGKIQKLFSPIQLQQPVAKREYYSVPNNDEAVVVSDKDPEVTQQVVMISLKHEAIPDSIRNTYAIYLTESIKRIACNVLNQRLHELSLKPECPFRGASVDDGDFLLSSKVTGAFNVEVYPKEGRVEEAVQAARENAALNGLANCSFLCGDVLKVLDEITQVPEMIVMDPPRDGVNPKALQKIMRRGAENLLYISCKPASLVRDIPALRLGGYEPQRLCLVDMFPNAAGCEAIAEIHPLPPSHHPGGHVHQFGQR